LACLVGALAQACAFVLVQFLKNGLSGEFGILRQLDNVRVPIRPADMKFTNQMEGDDKIRTRQMTRKFSLLQSPLPRLVKSFARPG
jgi:hypothetical protein